MEPRGYFRSSIAGIRRDDDTASADDEKLSLGRPRRGADTESWLLEDAGR
jgi:hypothetical protein